VARALPGDPGHRRGDAGPGRSAGSIDEALIRIHPTRILSFGIEEPRKNRT